MPLRAYEEPPDIEVIKTLVNTKTKYLYVGPNPGLGTIPLYLIEKLPSAYQSHHYEEMREERLWGHT